MYRRNVFACLCSFFIITSTALADTQVATEHLGSFEGVWSSSGPAFGAPARSNMRWVSDLDGKFLRLNYRIEMQTGEEAPAVFQGVAYYKSTSGKNLSAFWADNSGDLHPIAAEWDGTALVSNWGVIGKKQGRTRYELIDSDEMAVTDWIKTGDGWRQFNHNVFRRQ